MPAVAAPTSRPIRSASPFAAPAPRSFASPAWPPTCSRTSAMFDGGSEFFLALVPYFFGMTLYYWLILPRLEKQINYTMSAISKHSLAHFMKWRGLLVKQFLGNFIFLILFLLLISNCLPIFCSLLLKSNACPNVHELISNSLLTFGFISLHFLAFLSKFKQTIVFVLAYILLMLAVNAFDRDQNLDPSFFNGFIGFWVVLIFSRIYYQLLRIYRFIFTV